MRRSRDTHATAPRRRPTRAQTAVVGLLRTAGAIRRDGAAVIERFGITGQQYNVLRILRGARPDPLPTLAIAERMLEHTPGITRLLDRLEKKALIVRRRCVEDRRQVLCTISATGIALLQRMDEPVAAADAAAVARLSPPQVVQLIQLLEAVLAGKE